MKNRERYSISELARKASVTKRTVHYYVSRGIIPPPEGEGVHSFYSDDHLQRLLLIKKLKEQYYPLQKIKETLKLLNHDEVKESLGIISDDNPLQINLPEDRIAFHFKPHFKRDPQPDLYAASRRIDNMMSFSRLAQPKFPADNLKTEEIVRTKFHNNIELNYPKSIENSDQIRKIIREILRIMQDEESGKQK